MAKILIGNIKGPQGIQGIQGNDGATGPQGPPGPMGAVDNTTPIEFTEAAQLANLVSGDSIATLFGKQKKWNADILPIQEVVYSNDTKEEALNKLNNPLTIFGLGRDKPYYMLFNDMVGDSILGGGISCIFGYETMGQSYGFQFILKYGQKGSTYLIRMRAKFGSKWSDLYEVYNGMSGLSPADIGAASVEEFKGSWNKFRIGAIGWYRIGEFNRAVYGDPNSCSVTLKKSFASMTGECHKLELISLDTKSVFKSIYDATDAPQNMQISKIRCIKHVISSSNIYYYLDVYSNAATANLLSFTFSDASGVAGGAWEALSPTQTVPETATGETILAELEFEANSWLGGSL